MRLEVGEPLGGPARLRWVSPQVVTRYSSATIQAGDVAVVAVERRQRWRGIAARMEDRR